MTDTKPHKSSVVAAAWSPLAIPAFQIVWIAVLISNIGGWMASVATAWLMTTLDPSPLMVSLVSAATGLPLFLFARPAGALADIVDRRKLLIFAQFFMMVLVIVLLVMSMTGLITPLTLLILIFLIETGTAFETPAFLAVLPELVPKRQLQAALALNGVGINISRVSLGAHLDLQLAHLTAQRRLRRMQPPLGGDRDVLRFGHGDEIPEMP